MAAPPSSHPPSVEDVLSLQRDIITRLLHSDAIINGDVETALPLVTEASAQLIEVRRASVWRFDDTRTRIACLDLYDAKTQHHERGLTLRAEDAPNYFAAAVQHRCIVAHDARSDPRTREFTASYLIPNGITAMLDAPVLVRGELVGVVCHEHVGGARRWHQREELLAGTLADFVGTAWGAVEYQAQARELGRLRDGLEIRVAERTKELEQSRENVRALFAASPVAMLLVRESDDSLLLANESASELFEVAPESTRGKPASAFWVDADAQKALLEAVRKRGIVVGFESELVTRSGKFWASISARSLMFEGESAMLIGVQDISERKALEQQLRVLAITDELMGIYNRRYFFEHAEPLIALAERHERELSAALVDVDLFKAINDRHGHLVGDEALRLLARVCRHNLRTTDVLARFGGEELVILFPETGGATARAAVARVQEALRDSLIPGAAEPLSLTVSAGVAERRRGEALEELLRRADTALYQAKRAGRDRIVVAE